MFDDLGSILFYDLYPWKYVTDSVFRVTWNKVGTYQFEISIVDANAKESLASTEVTVHVLAGDAIILTHEVVGTANGLTEEKLEVRVNKADEMEYKVVADLGEADGKKVSHVDGTLYICEVQKLVENNWQAADKDDFVITRVDGNENTQGINKTFTVVEDVLRGYWGPQTGFTLAKMRDTTMTVQFNTAGTYKVRVYAIQVDPVAAIDLDDLKF